MTWLTLSTAVLNDPNLILLGFMVKSHQVKLSIGKEILPFPDAPFVVIGCKCAAAVVQTDYLKFSL